MGKYRTLVERLAELGDRYSPDGGPSDSVQGDILLDIESSTWELVMIVMEAKTKYRETGYPNGLDF